MRTFDLGERFDVVLCVYDSINHLLRFEEWRSVFARAHEHLNEDGLFIFDINTQHKLAEFAGRPAMAEWFGDGNLMVLEISTAGRGVANWGARVFERVHDSEYRLHSEDIPEISFPPERIRAALERLFSRVSVLDSQRSRPTARSERLHFVCRA
jgi:hypothetical protein